MNLLGYLAIIILIVLIEELIRTCFILYKNIKNEKIRKEEENKLED